MRAVFYGAILLPLLGSLAVPFGGRHFRRTLALLISLITLLLLLLLISPVWHNHLTVPMGGGEEISGFHLFWLPDKTGLLFALIFAFIGGLTVIYSLGYMEPYPHQREYYFILSLTIGSLVGLAFAGNLLLIYIFWEVAAIGTWRLVGFYRGPEQVKFANQAFMMTFFGASLMLLGFILIYREYGTFNLIELCGEPIGGVALSLIFLGIIAQSATLPLQTWLSDAHLMAPSPMSALLSGIVVKIGLLVFVRIFIQTVGVPYTGIIILAAISFLVAGGGALMETDMKKIIAYSTIAQMGAIIIGLGLMEKMGVTAGLLLIFAHALAKVGLVLGAGIVERSCGERDIRQLGGLIHSLPLTGLAFLACCLSIIGLPPFLGFYGKFWLVSATIKTGHLWLAVVVIIGSVFTLLYLLRLFNAIFLGKTKLARAGEKNKLMVTGVTGETPVLLRGVREENKLMLVPVVILGVLSLLLGIFITYTMGLVGPAGEELVRSTLPTLISGGLP
jgi:formate hydrogenlyase subunit 3/multisubunit Na+/H+ antiporter MnhD subunit